MAKKKKKLQETTIEDYYDLKVDKVDELVAALKGEGTEDIGEVSMNIADCTGVEDSSSIKRWGKQKQFDPYKTDWLGKIPTWIKAVFIKWWFAGVICYFVNMGLGIYVTNDADRLVLSGIVMGLIVELLVNPLFKFMESDRREYDIYMMFPFPFKAYWTFFTNVIYYVLVTAGISLCYYVINEYMFFLGMEPLLYGVFAVLVDMIFIGIKDGIVLLVKKLKNKESIANV